MSMLQIARTVQATASRADRLLGDPGLKGAERITTLYEDAKMPTVRKRSSPNRHFKIEELTDTKTVYVKAEIVPFIPHAPDEQANVATVYVTFSLMPFDQPEGRTDIHTQKLLVKTGASDGAIHVQFEGPEWCSVNEKNEKIIATEFKKNGNNVAKADLTVGPIDRKLIRDIKHINVDVKVDQIGTSDWIRLRVSCTLNSENAIVPNKANNTIAYRSRSLLNLPSHAQLTKNMKKRISVPPSIHLYPSSHPHIAENGYMNETQHEYEHEEESYDYEIEQDESNLLNVFAETVTESTEATPLTKFVTEKALNHMRKYLETCLCGGSDPLSGKMWSAVNMAMAVVGPKGRKLFFSDYSVTLEIPEGALSEQMVIHIFRKMPEKAAVEVYSPNIIQYAPTIDCGPDGLKFSKPVKLTFKHDIAKSDRHRTEGLQAFTRSDGEEEWQKDDKFEIHGEWVTVETHHFSGKTLGAEAKGVGNELLRINGIIDTVITSDDKRYDHEIDLYIFLARDDTTALKIYQSDVIRLRKKGRAWVRKEPLYRGEIVPDADIYAKIEKVGYKIKNGVLENKLSFSRTSVRALPEISATLPVPMAKENRHHNPDVICELAMQQDGDVLHIETKKITWGEHVDEFAATVCMGPNPPDLEGDEDDETKIGEILSECGVETVD